MTCPYQIKAQASGFTALGKVRFIFVKNSEYKHHLPPDKLFTCKQCLLCRLASSLEWSVRMMHEAQMHEESIFLTLTQNPEHMPSDRQLDHRHFQLFLKRMRKHYGPMRFYMCGEYGDNKINPHYHAIIFGVHIDDMELFTTNQRGDKIYKSATVEKIWGRGFITIGEVNKTTCAYTAGYLLKDMSMTGIKQLEYPDSETGEIINRKRPYNGMSTNPGIGKDWYDKFNSDVFPHDYCVHKGQKVPTPSYYRRLLVKANPELAEQLLALRELALETEQFKENNTPARIKVRAKVKALNLKRLTLEKQL